MMYWFGGMGLFGGLLMLVFWVAVVLLIVWLVRSVLAAGHTTGDTPLAILKRRYAAGEISQEEYEQTRRILAGDGSWQDQRGGGAL